MKSKNQSKKQSLVNKLAEKYIHIHYSKKNRLKWRWACFVIYFVIFLFFIGAALCFTLAGLKFQETTPEYIWPTNKPLFISGLVLFFVGVVLLIVLGCHIVAVFNESRSLYFKTKKYEKTRMKYMESDLTKYSLKEIKWLYKLQYIDKVKSDTTIAKIKK